VWPKFLFSVGRIGKVSWKNNWVAFLDSILQMKVFEQYSRSLFVLTFLQKLTIDIKQHDIDVQELEAKNEDVGELDPFSLNETVTLLLLQPFYLNNRKLQTFCAFLLHTCWHMVSTKTVPGCFKCILSCAHTQKFYKRMLIFQIWIFIEDNETEQQNKL